MIGSDSGMSWYSVLLSRLNVEHRISEMEEEREMVTSDKVSMSSAMLRQE